MANVKKDRGNVSLRMLFLTVISAVLFGRTAHVLAHGKLMEPLGMSVDPKLAASSQSDVAIGATRVSPCGTTLGKPFDRNDMTPRAEYYPGQTATLKWEAVNQDGAGPLRVRFSADRGRTWTNAQVGKNVPGIIGLSAAGLPIIGGNKLYDVDVQVPNMECPPGSCMMLVTNPLTFGSCVPVSIQSSNKGETKVTFENQGGDYAGGGRKGLTAGGIGGILDVPGTLVSGVRGMMGGGRGGGKSSSG